jgi:hypothetical protein
VSFDYLANLRKLKKRTLINEKPNQGVREGKKLGYTGLDNQLTDGIDGRALLPGNVIFLLLVLISVRDCVNHWV